MKHFLLLVSCTLIGFLSKAQSEQVRSLPPGRYETKLVSNNNKWERGDIILLNEGKYKMSTSNEEGAFKFSITTQRIFFTSGPLQTVFAKVTMDGNNPVIIIPKAENEQKGLKLASADIWGYYKE